MSIAEEAPTILPPSTTTSLLFSFPMQRRWRSLRLPTSIHNYYICIPISTNFHTLIRGAGNLSKHSCRSHQSSHLGQHMLLLKVEGDVLSVFNSPQNPWGGQRPVPSFGFQSRSSFFQTWKPLTLLAFLRIFYFVYSISCKGLIFVKLILYYFC